MGQVVIDFRYRDYIASDEWKDKRRERLGIDGHECSNCDSTKRLEVHHLTYERLFNERMEDLVTLCQECHARLHGRGPTRLRAIDEKTPRQEDLERREAGYLEFAIAAKVLDEAVDRFCISAERLPYANGFGEAAEDIRALATDLFDNGQRWIEHERWLRTSAGRRAFREAIARVAA